MSRRIRESIRNPYTPKIKINVEEVSPDNLSEAVESETVKRLVDREVAKLVRLLDTVEQLAVMEQSDPTLVSRIEEAIQSIGKVVGLPLPRDDVLEELAYQLSRALPPDEARIVYAAARGLISSRTAAEELYRHAVARGLSRRMGVSIEQAEALINNVVNLDRFFANNWGHVMRIMKERHHMGKLKDVTENLSKVMKVARVYYGKSLPKVLRNISSRYAGQAPSMAEFLRRLAEKLNRGESVEQSIEELMSKLFMESRKSKEGPKRIEEALEALKGAPPKEQGEAQKSAEVMKQLFASISGVKRHVYREGLSIGGSSNK